MPLSFEEQLGIRDLLLKEEQNVRILHQLARSVTKNICEIGSDEEALDYIFTHIEDGRELLSKKHLTKEILFKYLNSRKVRFNADFTKNALINKVLDYWKDGCDGNQYKELEPLSTIASADYSVNDISQLGAVSVPTALDEKLKSVEVESQYPINLLAQTFGEWFFNKYNTNSLKKEDFWPDIRLLLHILANDSQLNNEIVGAEVAIETLTAAKEKFGFYFNPNLTHEGVQGRMDSHGLVLVLACGTLHTSENCVGTFECTFGLVRDLFSENNWKVKSLQCLLRSKDAITSLPSLYESDSLKNALELPLPTDDSFS